MQVKWLRTALKNLDNEAKYIAQDDPQAAQLVVQRIVHTVSLLSDNPSLGHPGRVPGTHCIFWPIPITDSGLNRSPILEHGDH